MIEVRCIGEFSAQGDDGTIHVIHMLQEFIAVKAGGTKPGAKSLVTADGLNVIRKEKGVYEIVYTGKIIRSDDPNAP